MRTPRTVDVELTAACNLRCTYCYFYNNPAVAYRDLPTGDLLQFFEECGRLGVMQLTLAGGEPFIRKDLKALLRGIVNNRMRYSLLSNGSLINNDISAFIASTGRCDYVQVSIDGSGPETHDACRGAGSWEGAVRGIRTLQRHSVPVTSRVTIHRHNVDDLEGIARLLLEDLGLEGFGTNSAGYLGACRGNSGDVLLTVEQRQRAMDALVRLDEMYPGRISATAGPLAEAHMWREMEEARAKGAPAFDNSGHLTGCGCPYNKISVRADGAIVPCAMLAHMELGRINRDSLANVWLHSPALNALRERQNIPLQGFAFCNGCEYVRYCTGNCPGLAYSIVGEVNHPSPDACLRKFKEEAEKTV
jgi:SynChlorMet cassette radical SAM/SPASM protein ScmE